MIMETENRNILVFKTSGIAMHYLCYAFFIYINSVVMLRTTWCHHNGYPFSLGITDRNRKYSIKIFIENGRYNLI